MEQKNSFLKSKVRSKITFSASPLGFLLAACGGGGGTLSIGSSSTNNVTDDSSSTNNVTDGSSSTNNMTDDFSNSQLLSDFNYQYVSTNETYSVPENTVNSNFDQNYAVVYTSGFHEQISTKSLPMPSDIEIAGLIFTDPNDVSITDDIWNSNTTPTKVSYSFFNKDLMLLDENAYTSSLSDTVYNGDFVSFTATEKVEIKRILGEFEKVANIQFIEVDEVNNQVGVIRFGRTAEDLGGTTRGFTKQPNPYWQGSGDIWITYDSLTKNIGEGKFGSHVLLHELGHAVGLEHPHEGNFLMPSNLDNSQFTLMSYKDPSWAWQGGQYTTGDFYLSSSLMVYDIQALQYLYGANGNHNVGNTIYKFDSSERIAISIWDAAGEDLLDFSDFNIGCEINLVSGTYSTIRYPGWNVIDNFGIAFGSDVENVKGSNGSDTITGNDLNNEIMGYNGNDIMYGGDGDDVFDQASDSRNGDDTMYGGKGDDIYVVGKSNNDLIIELVDEGYDIVYVQHSMKLPENCEEIRGLGSRNFFLEGNNLDNAMHGGSGNDRLTGHDGADKFLLYLGMGQDVVTDYNSNEGDQVLLAFGLDVYSFANTNDGASYTLSDGSSLELIYEIII